MPDYVRGENITLTANYTNAAGTPITSGISGNTLDIYYYTSSGTRTYYVNSASMSQDAIDLNRYYYYFSIPNNAPITNVVTAYNAMFSGLVIQNTETFGVSAAVSNTGIYIGSVAVSGYIVDFSGTGIANAAVQVSPSSGGEILTSTVTNTSGLYVLYLDPGDYLEIASAANYLSNSVAQTVTSGTTIFANITLLSSAGTGAVSFSDTYLTTDPNNNNLQIPLSNLKISLFAKTGAATLTQPLAVTRTDANGTFVFTANNGDYVLKVEGNGPNNTVFDTAYDIEVSDAYAGGSPEGFRYRGTSQYGFI